MADVVVLPCSGPLEKPTSPTLPVVTYSYSAKRCFPQGRNSTKPGPYVTSSSDAKLLRNFMLLSTTDAKYYLHPYYEKNNMQSYLTDKIGQTGVRR